MAALAVLRITYSLRSSASCTITSLPRPMKTWRRIGSFLRTAGDIGMSRSTGTSRQPSSTWPSALIARSSSCSQARREACSLGRKIMPTPYSPGGGSSTPCLAISSRYSASGSWIRMPAPSPISLSAPTAPRWSRFSRIFSAWLDDGVALLALDVGHEADAAGVVLVGARIQAVFLQMGDLGSRRHGALLRLVAGKPEDSAVQHTLPSKLIGVRFQLIAESITLESNWGQIKVDLSRLRAGRPAWASR